MCSMVPINKMTPNTPTQMPPNIANARSLFEIESFLLCVSYT